LNSIQPKKLSYALFNSKTYMDKLHLLYYAILALFVTIYIMRSVLMVGYEHIKFRNKREQAGKMIKEFVSTVISFKPLFQKKLEPKGYDYKLYNRFQRKFVIYYSILWVCLFLILFFSAKLFLGLF
jgi:hypothetical protein